MIDLLYALARPALFRLDPERAHAMTLAMLRFVGPLLRGSPAQSQHVDAFGLCFPNRVGLAAGMDKGARALPAWAALGFGHVEVGTVTPVAQPGNPKPRVWRYPSEGALVNSMGFPSDGASVVSARLDNRPPGLIVGASVGPNRSTVIGGGDVAADCVAAAATLDVDYLAINVSSPNTWGLRSFQSPADIEAIVRAVCATGRPVLVKLSPDLSLDALPDLVEAARGAGARGLIATNTTSCHSRPDMGGLSGRPLAQRALRMTEALAVLADRNFPIISVGGIATPQDVRDRLSAGATLVQVYTALVYGGPGLVRRLATA